MIQLNNANGRKRRACTEATPLVSAAFPVRPERTAVLVGRAAGPPHPRRGAAHFVRAAGIALVVFGSPAQGQMLKVKGSLGAGIEWESNPFHLPPRERPRGDLRSSPALRLEVAREIGTAGVSLTGDVRYDDYWRERELDALRLRLDARGHLLVAGRCRAKAAVTFDRRRSDPADVGTVTAQSRSLDATLSASCPREAGLHPQFTVRTTDQSQSGSLERFYDSRTTSLTTDLLYSRPSLGTAGVSLGYGRIDRPDLSPLPGIDLYRGALRFDRYVAARLGGGLALGYAHFRPRGGGQEIGLAEWRADLRWLVAPDRSISARFAREARADGNAAAAIAEVTTANLDLSFRLGGRTRLTARAEREWRDFRGAVPTENRPARDDDRTTRLAVQLEYRLAPTLLLDAHVTHAARSAAPASYRYRSTGTGLRLRYTF